MTLLDIHRTGVSGVPIKVYLPTFSWWRRELITLGTYLGSKSCAMTG